HALGYFCTVDIPLFVGRNPLCNAGTVGSTGIGIGDESGNKACFRAAYADPPVPARIAPGACIGFRVRGIEGIVVVDVQAAGSSELGPGCHPGAILFEDLQAAVAAIGDEQTTL